MSDTIICKYIISPVTNKSIKVGGKAYKKLMKDGVINGTIMYDDEKILYKINIDDLIEMKKAQLDDELPEEFHAVKGRGLYKGYLIRRKKDEYSLKREQMNESEDEEDVIINLE